ncbi:MAG: prepilin-type N-terminal cleavage/methylation domain-containing protein [Bacilli bacterium]|nr:prepilin-type N-terminal cleavage/methylation domain-containing protein [Bacilli bacterium]
MGKKGFTLVELLAVIVLISIITLIAIPSIRYADKKITQKNYETKKELIKTAAEEYGDDYKELIVYASTPTYYTDASGNSYPSLTITVRDLLRNGYITKDTDIKTEDVLDPRDDTSLLDKTIIVYIKNNRSYAKLNFN